MTRQTIHIPGVGEVAVDELADDPSFRYRSDTRDVPRELAADAPTDVAVHFVYPPQAVQFEADWQRAQYVRIWPYLWWACDHPDRPADEAMLIDTGRCNRCLLQWRERGLPLPTLPPLPADAPRLR